MHVMCAVCVALLPISFRTIASIRVIECPVMNETIYGQTGEVLRFRSFSFPNGLISSKDAGCNVTFKAPGDSTVVIALLEVQPVVPAAYFCQTTNGSTIIGQMHLESAQKPVFDFRCQTLTLILPANWPFRNALLWMSWEMQIFIKRIHNLCILDENLNFDPVVGVSRLMIGVLALGSYTECRWLAKTSNASQHVKVTIIVEGDLDPQTVLEFRSAGSIIDQRTGYELLTEIVIRLDEHDFSTMALEIALHTRSQIFLIVGLYSKSTTKRCDYDLPIGVLKPSTTEGYVFEPLVPRDTLVPVKMLPNQHCSWSFWAEDGYYIIIRIFYFHMEAADRVTITTTDATYSVTNRMTLYTSWNDTVSFSIETDEEGELGGLSMNFQVIKCEPFRRIVENMSTHQAIWHSDTSDFLFSPAYCPKIERQVTILNDELVLMWVGVNYNIYASDIVVVTSNGTESFQLPAKSAADCVDNCPVGFSDSKTAFYGDTVVLRMRTTNRTFINNIAFRLLYAALYVYAFPVVIDETAVANLSDDLFHVVGSRLQADVLHAAIIRALFDDETVFFAWGLPCLGFDPRYFNIFAGIPRPGDMAQDLIEVNNAITWRISSNVLTVITLGSQDCYSYVMLTAASMGTSGPKMMPRIVGSHEEFVIERGESLAIAGDDSNNLRRGFVFYSPRSTHQNCRFELSNPQFGDLYANLSLRCYPETMSVSQKMVYLNADIVFLRSFVTATFWVWRTSLETVRFGLGDKGFWTNTQWSECFAIPYVKVATKLALKFQLVHLNLRNTTLFAITMRGGNHEVEKILHADDEGGVLDQMCVEHEGQTTFSLTINLHDVSDSFLISFEATRRRGTCMKN